MEADAERIEPYLLTQQYPVKPWECKGHLWEHQGWDFVDAKFSSIKLVARCAYCGTIAYGLREYRAVGPRSFDLEDEALIRSGVLGEYWLERKWKEDRVRMGY